MPRITSAVNSFPQVLQIASVIVPPSLPATTQPLYVSQQADIQARRAERGLFFDVAKLPTANAAKPMNELEQQSRQLHSRPRHATRIAPTRTRKPKMKRAASMCKRSIAEYGLTEQWAIRTIDAAISQR